MMGRALIAAGMMLAISLPGYADVKESADVSGRVCVIDGDTVVINGKRSHATCTGGQRVNLFGIDAPELEQICTAPNGRGWYCGKAAAAAVLKLAKRKTVVCKGDHRDENGERLAICYLGGESLNALMVRSGWALAYEWHSPRYLDDARTARKNRKGIWQGRFKAPWDWRKKK
jgi:endonuclease YncB( thermonuclease family)